MINLEDDREELGEDVHHIFPHKENHFRARKEAAERAPLVALAAPRTGWFWKNTRGAEAGVPGREVHLAAIVKR